MNYIKIKERAEKIWKSDFQKRLESECIKVKFDNDKTIVSRKIFCMKNINYKDINLEEIILELEHNNDKGPIKVMSDDLKSARIVLHGFFDKKLLFDAETMKYEEKTSNLFSTDVLILRKLLNLIYIVTAKISCFRKHMILHYGTKY